MTRGLHKDTRVQRGDPGDVSKTARRRGYEAGEAPPVKAALGLAAFVAVMFVGLGAAGLVANVWSGAHLESTAAATRGSEEPPPPRLLANPAQQRREIEGAARQRLEKGAVPIDRAMGEVARRGWGEDAPAPAATEVAREHAEAAR